jgi:hypothetical protein
MRKKIFLFLFSLMVFCTARAQTDSTRTDSLLLLQIQNQMQQQASALAVPARSAASANPDISAIGDFRLNYASNLKRNFNAELHEAEISLQSVVDPYARADFFISLSRNAESGEFGAEVEEGYLTTLSLPGHLQLRAGKFKQTLGKINSIHPHALPFVDMPNAYVRFFGEEGLNDEGISVSWLLPNHAFFQELTFELTDGPRDNPSFVRSSKNNYLKLIKLKNFWDLTSNATLELGLTGISGENVAGNNMNMGAVDIAYKWKPVQFNTYKSFTFQNELYLSSADYFEETVKSIGWFSLVNMQVSKRTFVTARYDYTNLPSSNLFVEQAASATLGWYATEFQKIELEGKYTTANQEEELNNFKKNFYSVFLRWIFVIGTHGAHQY